MCRFAFLVCLGLVSILVDLPAAKPQAPKPTPKRYAILVGINAYKHPKLPALKYAVNDVTDLKKILEAGGYEVILLTDDTATKPTSENIDTAINGVLRKAQNGDTVLLALAGHGLQFGGDKDSYFCPIDARPFKDETKTLLSIASVYTQMEKSFAGVKILLVDACRDDPDEGRGSRGVDADSAPPPPRGVAAFFSCSAKQKAYEHASLKHGIFFHYVLEGLRGEAKNSQDEVTFNSLVDYVAGNVEKSVPKLFDGAQQQPNQKADFSGRSPLLLKLGDDMGKVSGPPKPLKAPFTEIEAKKSREAWAAYLKIPERKTLELPNEVKLELVLIPPGIFRMGSPKDEEGRYEDEAQHVVEITKPFYMAVTETTQEQYAAVMGENPSDFQKGGKRAKEVKGKDTDEFPVENVSWNDAVWFCEKSKVKGMQLPSEAQWEYVCRAGTKTPYFYGDDITEGKANYNQKLGRTEKVASYAANSFGLFDMDGNVFEWCADYYRKDYEVLEKKDPINKQPTQSIVLRGGSWDLSARGCRAAGRNNYKPESRGCDFGFRVVVLP